jgi:hypothetical protein
MEEQEEQEEVEKKKKKTDELQPPSSRPTKKSSGFENYLTPRHAIRYHTISATSGSVAMLVGRSCLRSSFSAQTPIPQPRKAPLAFLNAPELQTLRRYRSQKWRLAHRIELQTLELTWKRTNKKLE